MQLTHIITISDQSIRILKEKVGDF